MKVSISSLVRIWKIHQSSPVVSYEFYEWCKFNIARNFLWEGAKRAVSRKVFSPGNKVSVKFTDDSGIGEGAIDWGGPMREFFTLILQYIHDS